MLPVDWNIKMLAKLYALLETNKNKFNRSHPVVLYQYSTLIIRQ